MYSRWTGSGTPVLLSTVTSLSSFRPSAMDGRIRGLQAALRWVPEDVLPLQASLPTAALLRQAVPRARASRTSSDGERSTSAERAGSERPRGPPGSVGEAEARERQGDD